MNTVICAVAGLSSRMGDYKPLLPLGDQTIIRTLITRYRESGIRQIILVTGHNADLLEEHVNDLGVICRRNPQYATSDMLQSVKIGIRAYLDDGEASSDSDRVFLTPGDIPLVNTDTLKKLLEAEGDVCAPTYEGRQGHPLCLSRHILEDILPYEGDNGLKGALGALGCNIVPVPVNDPGILVDADTPEDYTQLRQLFSGLGE